MPYSTYKVLFHRGLLLGAIAAVLFLYLGLFCLTPASGQASTTSLVVSPETINFGEVHPNKDYTRSVTITNTGSTELSTILLRVNSAFIYYDKPDSGPDYTITVLNAGESKAVPITLAMPDGSPVGDNQATLGVMLQGTLIKEVKITFRLPIILNVSPSELTLQLQPGGNKVTTLNLKDTSDTGSVTGLSLSLQADPQKVSQRDMDLIRQYLVIRPEKIATILPRSQAQVAQLQMIWDKSSSLKQGKYPIFVAIQYGGLADKDRILISLTIRLVPEDIDWDTRINGLKAIETIPGINLDLAQQGRGYLKWLVDLIPNQTSTEYYDTIKPALEASLSIWETAEKVNTALRPSAESVSQSRQSLPSIQEALKRLSDLADKTGSSSLQLPMRSTYNFMATVVQKLGEAISNAATTVESGQKEATYTTASTELAAGNKDVQDAGKPLGPDSTIEKSQQLYQSAIGHLDKAIGLFNSILSYKDSNSLYQQATKMRKDAADTIERRQKIDIPKAYQDLGLQMGKGNDALAGAQKATTLNPSVSSYRVAVDNFTSASNTAALIPDKGSLGEAQAKKLTAETGLKDKTAELNKTTTDAQAARQAGDENIQKARTASLLSDSLRFFQEAQANFEKAQGWYARIPDEPSRQYSERNLGDAQAGVQDRQTKIASTKGEADSLLQSGTADLERAKTEKLLITSLDAASSASKALEKARDLYNLIPLDVQSKEAEGKRSEAANLAASKQSEVNKNAEDYKMAMDDGNAALSSATAAGPLPTRLTGYSTAKGNFDRAYILATQLPDPVKINEAGSKRQEAEVGEKSMQTQIEGNRRDGDRLAASGKASFDKGNRLFVYFLAKSNYQAALKDIGTAIELYNKVGGRDDKQKADELQGIIPLIQAKMVQQQRLQMVYFAVLGLIISFFSYLYVRRYMEEKFVAREVEVEALLFNSPPGQEGRQEK